MSAPFKVTKWGDKRRRTVRINKGHTVNDSTGTFVLEEDGTVEVEETWSPDPAYSYLKTNGDWRGQKYIWDTFKPKAPRVAPPAPPPPPPKLTWWQRLMGHEPIASARVIKK